MNPTVIRFPALVDCRRPPRMATYKHWLVRLERRHKLFAGLALIGLAMVISWGLA